jgi:hypothetical protein
LRSPVIEVSRSFENEQILRAGRLYYVDRYYDRSGKLTEKTLGFRKWARNVLSKARKSLQYDENLEAYIGQHAALLRDRGIELEHS